MNTIASGILCFAFFVTAATCPAIVCAEARRFDHGAVTAAIKRAEAFILSHQVGGTWDHLPTGNHLCTGGVSALALYALRAADMDPNDPRIKPAIDAVLQQPSSSVYEVGVKSQLYNLVPMTEKLRASRMREFKALAAVTGTEPAVLGMYPYLLSTEKERLSEDRYHISTSNYGVLGMWGFAEGELDVPTKYWETVDRAWRNAQNADGGWSYHFTDGSPEGYRLSLPSMATAGLATLLIAGDHMRNGDSAMENDRNIVASLKYIDQNFGKILSPGAGLGSHPATFYSLYNIERIGTASGLRYVGSPGTELEFAL